MPGSRLHMGALLLLLFAAVSGCAPASKTIEPPLAHAAAPIDQMPRILIPAGRFVMGNADDKGEMPAHAVELSSFLIDRTEVTNGQYTGCVMQGVCQPPAHFRSYLRPEYYADPEYAAYPVIYVDWEDADTFCRWAGGRLPTEAEWERAARGPTDGMYPWGDQAPQPSQGNFDFSIGDTSPADAYPLGASQFGVLDMAGNVSEWVADWFESDYYSLSPFSDPMGPLATGARVVRGGSWWDNANTVRSDGRVGYPPGSAFMNLGFRCAESTWALPGFAAGAVHHTLR